MDYTTQYYDYVLESVHKSFIKNRMYKCQPKVNSAMLHQKVAIQFLF